PATARAGQYRAVDTDQIDLRSLAMHRVLSREDLAIVGHAGALMNWHRSNSHCAVCGTPTVIQQGGYRRGCPGCGRHHFPRTDPVAIMLAVDGERCVLGRQPRFPPGMYSCLAGFIEPGEGIEDAVRRELAEESGLEVGRVRYHASQPWPFPHTLMIGCFAEALSDALTPEEEELEECRWFTRGEVESLLNRNHPQGFFCPPPMAIAHQLMRHWVSGFQT
ncbi:MAG: NAD(+) diphosphatase, partial [Pseudomonadota bacterium]